jgi:acyl-CoA dehydrogenase
MSFGVGEETERMRLQMREWALADVRPLAREADLSHAPPRRAAEVLAKCPIAISPISMAVDPAGERDGSGNTYLRGLTLMEEVTYGDMWPFTTMPGATIAPKAIKLLATSEQAERWVGGLERGVYRTSAFALTEPGCGSDVSKVATTAVRDGDEWVLNGSKIFCTHGAFAEIVVVFATIDRAAGRGGVRAFMVESGTPGFTVVKANERKLGLHWQDTATLAFDDARIPLDHCLGYTGDDSGDGTQRGVWGALETLTHSRPFVAAAAIGIGQAAIDYAADWVAANRHEYTSKRLSMIEDAIASMNWRLHQARYMVRRVGWLRDAGHTARMETSMAKAYAPPVAEHACLRAMQLMGPEGCSKDHLVEKWHRDIRIFDIWEGTGQIQRLTIARQLLGAGSGTG